MHNKMFKRLLFCINCIPRSLWKHLKPRKSQRFFNNMLPLNDAPNYTMYDFTSGGRKVAPHNGVPRGFGMVHHTYIELYMYTQRPGTCFLVQQNAKYTLHYGQYALKLHWAEPPMRLHMWKKQDKHHL